MLQVREELLLHFAKKGSNSRTYAPFFQKLDLLFSFAFHYVFVCVRRYLDNILQNQAISYMAKPYN